MTLDARLLRALRAAGHACVSLAGLSQQLGVSPPVLQERLAELRALGYGIEITPHRGFRLASVPDLLQADDLLSRLEGVEVVGRDIQIFRQTTSTNDVAERLGRDGVREGVVVFAETQTQGRGRLGRKWLSPPGKGLWFSVLLRPKLPLEAATQFTVAAATAVARAVRQHEGLVPEIKWPNDILLNGKKVVGILSELCAESDRIRHLILGIGVNVNFALEDFPPELRAASTSLRLETGRTVDRGEMAASILRELDADYRRLRQGAFSAVADEWERQCSTLGREVRIQAAGRRMQGLAEALDEDGALLVRTQHGRLEWVVGGDVTLVGVGASPAE